MGTTTTNNTNQTCSRHALMLASVHRIHQDGRMHEERAHDASDKFAELEQLDAMVKGLEEQLAQLTHRRNDLITTLGAITNTLPPSDVVTHRERLRQFEHTLGRAEHKNIVRQHNRNILLLVLLVTAAGTLTWWALRIMKGV